MISLTAGIPVYQNGSDIMESKKTKKSKRSMTTVKVLLLTVITFGLYGAYWAMNNMYQDVDVDDEEEQKGADSMERAAASALLMRHDLH